MSTRRLLVTLIAAGVFAAAPATARAASGRFVGPTLPGIAVSDVYFIYKPQDGAMRILDTRRRTSTTRTIPMGCYPQDVAGLTVLLACRTSGPDTYKLFFIPSSTVRDLPVREPTNMRFFALGLYWLSGTFCSAKCGEPLFLNWRTGEYRQPSGTAPRDLDSPTLALSDTARDETLVYAGPQHGSLYYQPPRHGKRILVSRCPDGCSGVVSRARVFLRDGKSFHSILLDSAQRQRQRWTIPLPAGLNLNVGVALYRTRYSAFVSVQESTGSATQRLYEVRWPKPRPKT